MESLLQFFKRSKEFLDAQTISIGTASLSLADIVYVIVACVLLVYLSSKLRRWIVRSLLSKRSPDIGVRQAIATIIHYIVVFIGLVIIFETTGIDLSSLALVVGGLGLGIGFGLQNIANDLVSGLVILFERPVKVGDRIQVGDTTGDIIRVGPRATTLKTNDNIAIIIPNSEFTSSRVINWSHSDRMVRLQIPVGVSYRSDPEFVRSLLLQVVGTHEGVLKKPEPGVMFNEFGESSLKFTLRVWTSTLITIPIILRSDLNFAIRSTFMEHGVEIPFPQRDLHLRSSSIPLPGAERGLGSKT